MKQNAFRQIAGKALAAAIRTAEEVRQDLTVGFGDNPNLSPGRNFFRGLRAGALATLGATGIAALAGTAEAQQGGNPANTNTDVVGALTRAIAPITEAMCWVYNQAALAVFVAAAIAVIIGFILKAFQARAWGLFVWGGVVAAAGVGILLAFISVFGNPDQNCRQLPGTGGR
ncbi:MAG: hypothetical protein QXD60_01455 [Nanopusillaceae archaeon]